MKIEELIVFVCGLILSIGMFIGSFFQKKSLFQPVGTEFIPRLGAILVILAILASVFSYVKEGRMTIKCANKTGIDSTVGKSHIKTTVFLLILSLIYMVSMAGIGYYVSTFVFLLFTTFLLGRKEKHGLKMPFVSSIIISAVLFVFYQFLNVYLPDGLLF